MTDLDFLRGLADKRGEIQVGLLPGLETPARATMVRIRRDATGRTSELTLEIVQGARLAALLEERHARNDRLETMTIAAHDTVVELKDLAIARIDGHAGRGTTSVHLRFPTQP